LILNNTSTFLLIQEKAETAENAETSRNAETRPSPHRAVNTFFLGYKTDQSTLQAAQVAVYKTFKYSVAERTIVGISRNQKVKQNSSPIASTRINGYTVFVYTFA
jgi:hypothetical protein